MISQAKMTVSGANCGIAAQGAGVDAQRYSSRVGEERRGENIVDHINVVLAQAGTHSALAHRKNISLICGAMGPRLREDDVTLCCERSKCALHCAVSDIG
jgi:hypothetical protein